MRLEAFFLGYQMPEVDTKRNFVAILTAVTIYGIRRTFLEL